MSQMLNYEMMYFPLYIKNWSRNLLTSLGCSIILCMWLHADDIMKPLKCVSVSYQ